MQPKLPKSTLRAVLTAQVPIVIGLSLKQPFLMGRIAFQCNQSLPWTRFQHLRMFSWRVSCTSTCRTQRLCHVILRYSSAARADIEPWDLHTDGNAVVKPCCGRTRCTGPPCELRAVQDPRKPPVPTSRAAADDKQIYD